MKKVAACGRKTLTDCLICFLAVWCCSLTGRERSLSPCFVSVWGNVEVLEEILCLINGIVLGKKSTKLAKRKQFKIFLPGINAARLLLLFIYD